MIEVCGGDVYFRGMLSIEKALMNIESLDIKNTSPNTQSESDDGTELHCGRRIFISISREQEQLTDVFLACVCQKFIYWAILYLQMMIE